MATDSAELTFVRCPSCRSLVPAVSTRCRMCGATLDTNQAEGGAEVAEEPKSSRVRQRTISAPDNDLSDVAELLRNEAEGQPEEEAASDDMSHDHDASDLDGSGLEDLEAADSEDSAESEPDPLSAYLEELEDNESPVDKDTSRESEDFDPLGLFAEEARQGGDEPAASEAAVDFDDDDSFDIPEKKGVDSAATEKETVGGNGNGQARAGQSSARRSEEAPARVVVESGVRRAGRGHGLSFGRGRSEQRAGGRVRRNEQAAESGAAKGTYGASARKQTEEGQRPVASAETVGDVLTQAAKDGVIQKNTSNTGPQMAEAKSGKLCGWLVSYKQTSGSAIELREGRFFISRASFKPGDLVLNEESVSAPHALVVINITDGFKIQDMMSEQGLFVKRKGTSDFQPIVEAVKLEHGDWLKLGTVEFLVCLVAG